MDIRFDSEPVYGGNDKYIKTNIEIYKDKGKKLPKENASYKCLLLIMLDSVVKVKKKYYPQTVLEEIKMENIINDELESSSSDIETESDSDNESHNE